MWIEVRPHGQSIVEILLTSMAASDWDAVRRIYVEGIATGHATFETEAPTWDCGSAVADAVTTTSC